MLKKIDKPLLFFSVLLFIIGLIMILSASSMESYMRYANSPYYYFIKQLIFVGSGLFIYVILLFIPTKVYKIISPALIVIIIFALGGLIVKGYVANNAASWYNLGFVSLQPSEFAKVILIVFLATYYDKYKNKLSNKVVLTVPLIIGVIIIGLVAIQPDMGTASIIFLIIMLIFHSVPAKKGEKQLITKLIFGGILLVGAVLLVTGGSILRDYQLERFNYFNPCDRYQDESGYQLCNSFIAFKNGELTGQGIGKSTQKYLYLPESYTDFIFPIIVEEWGLLGGIVVLILFACLLYRLFDISRKAKNLRNSIIAYGVFIYILLHITINLGGVMGLLPLTGVPLPFLSYGGSYCWCLIAALGLASRVSIENKLG